MKRRISFFQIFMTIMSVIIAGLLLASGIIALQKSMNMKVGVNITPSHEIRIDYGGETIFCNTTKDSGGIKVASGYTLNGNTLTFTQEFISIGQTFALIIYNYNTSYLQVTISGTGATGNALIIEPYSTTASSGVLNLTTSASPNEVVLCFEKIKTYSVTYAVSNYTYSAGNVALEGNSYSTTVTASQFYDLPNSITVSMGGRTLTSGYTYIKTSDTVATNSITSVTGDIRISLITKAREVSVSIQFSHNDGSITHTPFKIKFPNTEGEYIVEGVKSLESYSGSGVGYSWSAVIAQTNCTVKVCITWGVSASNFKILIKGTKT